MNGAQLHLALNHLPVVLSIISFGTLLWGSFGKNFEIKKVGLIFVTLTAIFAGIAFLTGESAEEVIEKLPSFSKELVHEHEEAGEAALIVSIIAGVASLAALYLSKKKSPFFSNAFVITVILILISLTAFLRTSHLGGLISHEEIRPTSAN